MFFDIFCMGLLEVKPIFGIYDRQEILMENVSVEVVGRPYEKLLLISDAINEYQGSCVGLNYSVCEPYFNAALSARELKYIKMSDRSGFVLYMRFANPLNDADVIIDNVKHKEEIEMRYKRTNRYILYLLLISNLLPAFFAALWVFKKYCCDGKPNTA
ncbi:hypothetical protein BWD07_07960 [Neisseria canis]|nr:hypothetical protein BWD07_07960 [Neisseria canis]